MEQKSLYYIEKMSDTSADTLLAVGFMVLLGEILRQHSKSSRGITIQDVGAYFEIRVPIPITDSNLENLRPFAIIKPLVTEKYIDKYAKQGQMLDGFDYQRQQEIRKQFYEKLSKLPPEYRTPEAHWKKELLPLFADIEEPDQELGHYQAIQQMKIASSFNDLAQRWYYLDNLQREFVHILLELFSSPINDIDSAVASGEKLAKEHGLKKDMYVSALQIVNPTTGKGANYAKASELIRAIGNQDSFWLLELLKFVGFMCVAAPYIVQGSKDRKTYVLQPKRIELGDLTRTMEDFRSVCWSSTAIKLDIMASLRFTEAFIRHRQQVLQGEAEEDFFGEEQVYSVAHGFEVIFFKDMGSAVATMNVASIKLPSWLPQSMKTKEEAEGALGLVKEHLQIIQQLRNSKGEEGSEEYELLHFYRDFLSGHDLKPYWKFTAAYSGYLMSQHESEKSPKRWIRQLSFTGLEMLIMHSQTDQADLTEIIHSKGFQRIADAIRRSTVFAQYRRSQFDDRTYEVRYGLGQELMRKAKYNKEFLVALSEFLFEYESETAREDEKAARDIANKSGHVRPLTSQDRISRNLRYTTSEDDLKEIVALVNKYGAELVGSLLVAFGYAFKGSSSSSTEGSHEPAL